MTHSHRTASLAFVLLAGCQMPNPDPVPFPMSEGNEVAGSQVSVGLRVTLDPDQERQVHLVAVVQDLRGNVSVTDLGDYDGVVTEQPTTGEDLVHVAIVREDAAETIFLRSTDGFVNVHRMAPSGESVIIHRIPVAEGASIVPREPSLESE